MNFDYIFMTNLNLSQQNILNYWHTLEYLIPFNLDQTIDQAEANNRQYFRFDKKSNNSDLPWLVDNENKSNEYRVYFGVFDVRSANNELLRLFQKDDRDSRNDFWSCYGYFSIDNNGIPVTESLTLSGLPWALGHLESGEIASVIKNSDWNKLFKSYSLFV